LFLLVLPSHGQSEITVEGAIDTRVHSAPDSASRSIDADDLARLARDKGMRGLVLKNHYESTAQLAYMVRKAVPGIEVFGGIVLNRSVGGINLEAVKRMAMTKGGYGRVVWMPTSDSEAFVKLITPKTAVAPSGDKFNVGGPFVPVSKDGHLLPAVLDVIDFIAQHHEMLLETGRISAAEALMVVHEAHRRGVTHIVVTGAMDMTVQMTMPQMQEAARDGAYIEFAYSNTFGLKPQFTMGEFADAIRQIGPKSCILATNFGSDVLYPLHPQALLDFMVALHKEGISVADINLMAKTNPGLALGLGRYPPNEPT
jgi:hypothetical protein